MTIDKKTHRILGIDPGSQITGYGLLDADDNSKSCYVASGCIRVAGSSDHSERLKRIFHAVVELVAEYRPDELAIERVFVNKSAGSALKLGQARAAAICATFVDSASAIPVHEYAPREVKNAVTGSGAADKAQVQQMVVRLLELNATPQSDAADALAVAICHANMRRTRALLAAAERASR